MTRLMSKQQAEELAATIRQDLKDKFRVLVFQSQYKNIAFAVSINVSLSRDVGIFQSFQEWEDWKMAALVYAEKVEEDRMAKQLNEEAGKDLSRELSDIDLYNENGPHAFPEDFMVGGFNIPPLI